MCYSCIGAFSSKILLGRLEYITRSFFSVCSLGNFLIGHFSILKLRDKCFAKSHFLHKVRLNVTILGPVF